MVWWGYVHINGSIQVKRFYGWDDITEAEESDFVKEVIRPFVSPNREDALAQAKFRSRPAPDTSTPDI